MHRVNATQLVDSDSPREMLESSKRKVLILDDAHALWGGSIKSTWNEHRAAINALVAEASDRFILLAGYEDEVEEMFRHVNPGLSTRFPLASAFRFPPLSIAQLEQTLDNKVQEAGISLSPDAKSAALAVLRKAMVSPRFGNVSEVDALLHSAYFSRDKRCMADPHADPKVLEPEDFSKDWNRSGNAEQELELKKLFQDMVGCESVISELFGDARVAKKASARNLNPRDYISFNYVFVGAPGRPIYYSLQVTYPDRVPGTGKTTTARRMGEVFYQIGLLASAQVVECSVTDLIAEYVGQTGPKILNLFNSALGKVLFIDEAYRLYEGSTSSSSYSRDAVAEIVGALTSSRYQQKMVTILAGYSQEMDRLMDSNPGLRSRFNRTMVFPSLKPEQCVQLLLRLLESQRLDTSLIDLDDQDKAGDYFASLQRSEGWGNARDVHTLSREVSRIVLLCTDDDDDQLVVRIDHILKALTAMINTRGGRVPVPVDAQPKNAPPGWKGREWLEKRGYVERTYR